MSESGFTGLDASGHSPDAGIITEINPRVNHGIDVTPIRNEDGVHLIAR
jgi:hypothetical protein